MKTRLGGPSDQGDVQPVRAEVRSERGDAALQLQAAEPAPVLLQRGEPLVQLVEGGARAAVGAVQLGASEPAQQVRVEGDVGGQHPARGDALLGGGGVTGGDPGPQGEELGAAGVVAQAELPQRRGEAIGPSRNGEQLAPRLFSSSGRRCGVRHCGGRCSGERRESRRCKSGRCGSG